MVEKENWILSCSGCGKHGKKKIFLIGRNQRGGGGGGKQCEGESQRGEGESKRYLVPQRFSQCNFLSSSYALG